MQAGKFVSASEIRATTEEGLYPCYGGNGLRGYTATFTHSGTYSLIGRQGALCGNIQQGIGEFHATEHAIVVTPKNEVRGDWLFFILDFLNLNRFATGQAQPGLSVDVLEKLPIAVPSQEGEQQKIADCLSSLDQLIAAQAGKVATLKTHKEGLTGILFPREGETQPRPRFTEFRNAGNWIKAPAGRFFTNKVKRGDSDLPIYSVTMNNGLVPRTSLDRRVDDVAKASANKAARKGDIAYNMMRMWQGALGVAPEDCMVSPAYIVLTPQGVNPHFFSYQLKLPHTLQLLTAHSRGLTEDRLRLYYDDFARVPLSCPSLPEQNLIADCLASLDDLTATETKKLDALRRYKVGLMQQLFPSAEAVEA